MKRKKRLYLDIETFSSVDLKKTGVYKYADSPDFEILMCAWGYSKDDIRLATGEEEVLAIPGLMDPDVLKVAHNAQFERVCFSHVIRGHGVGNYLPAHEWHDTMAVAGELGYPQSLGTLAKELGVAEKDTAGTRLINLFCKPHPKRKRRLLPHEKPEEWEHFGEYCIQDVVTLIEVDEALGDFPTEHERQVYLADQAINDRGIAIDVELAKGAKAASEDNTRRMTAKIVQLTAPSDAPVLNPNSVPQMMAWARAEGVGIDNLRSETIGDWLRDNPDHHGRKVLELRLQIALAASKKFGAALGAVLDDDRLRGTLKFFGAHTGRWAGRGTQIQNLPRAAFKKIDPETGDTVYDEDEQNLSILDLSLGNGGSPLTLKKLVRPLFVGPFTIVDYSAIEAVVIAWLAGEEWALQAFREERDIYVETANRMGGLTRAQGKVAVLALGFGGGPGSLKVMAGDKDTVFVHKGKVVMGGAIGAAIEGKDSPSAKLIRDLDNAALYEGFVYPWRDANSNIVGMWKMLERRFRTGGAVGDHLFIEKDGSDRMIRLPSGRIIGYRKCRIKRDAEGRERLTFTNNSGHPADTYGGRLAENVTQAVARDLLGAALVRLEASGYRVVGHVHDEILVEGRYPVEEIAKIMCELPDWAEGLPVSGAGFTTERYKKD